MRPGDVFADTAYFVGLAVRNYHYHARARAWSQKVTGRIVTTQPVLFEVLNTLSRPAWRAAGVIMVESLLARPDVVIHELDGDLWAAGWRLYRSRAEKA